MNEFVITATRSMRAYASQVVRHLLDLAPSLSSASIDGVGMVQTTSFADGEMEAVIGDSVRGKEVILFTSCARNEAGIKVNEAKIELYHTIDALKRGQARKVTVFEPYVSCARSDRTTRRSSVGLWVHLKILASLGAEHFISYQLHSDKSKSMLDPTICLVDDIPGHTLLKRYLCDTYIRTIDTLVNEVRPTWAFCSVDAGGEKLARDFANTFGTPLVIAHKQRNYSIANTVDSVNILSAEPLEGKVLWIVDDMVDTGGSVETLIHALKSHKPKEINLIVMHALFSQSAPGTLNELSKAGLLNRIVASDTVYHLGLASQIPHFETVPSAGLSAQIINNLVTNRSMSQLFKVFNVETHLAMH